MSSKKKKASSAVRRRCRVFPRGNPCSVLAAVLMLLVVVWSHAVFYQLSVVYLPPRQTMSSDNVSRHQTSIEWTLMSAGHWTSTARRGRNRSMESQSSFNWTTPDRQLSQTVVKRVQSQTRIIIRSNTVSQTVQGRQSEKAEMGLESVTLDRMEDNVNQTVVEVRRGLQARRGVDMRDDRDAVVDRSGSAGWLNRRSRLLISAHHHREPTSPAVASSYRWNLTALSTTLLQIPIAANELNILFRKITETL